MTAGTSTLPLAAQQLARDIEDLAPELAGIFRVETIGSTSPTAESAPVDEVKPSCRKLAV